jgi:hypothetical protein
MHLAAISKGEYKMARYRVLFWRHIPLGVKATDVNGVVRVNLPARFQEAFQQAVAKNSKFDEGTYTTSSFRWSEAQSREGSANKVATLIAQEIEAEWDEETARINYEE